MPREIHRIREFESFFASAKSFDEQVDLTDSRLKPLDVETFNALEAFILENHREAENESQIGDFLTISLRRGKKVISAKNYVGLIAMNDGTTIEILPKIDELDEAKTAEVFLKMLSTLHDMPFKSLNSANVNFAKISLFEVFIRMFLMEVEKLVKRGLKSGYVYYEANQSFLKGRLDFNQQIKENLTHKERFFVGYDEFEANRPENKLIKSAILYVKKLSHNARNLQDCRKCLTVFADIDTSDNYSRDFALCATRRNMAEYETILKWCRVFLQDRSFTAFHGDSVAFALLFPMEQVFESYVAHRIRHELDRETYTIHIQDKRYCLFDDPPRYSLRPDIVVINKKTNEIVVLDTKWKRLSPQYQNSGIAQSDMYQMYVYHRKYSAKKVILIFPYSYSVSKLGSPLNYRTTQPESVHVEALFYDLTNDDQHPRKIKEAIIE